MTFTQRWPGALHLTGQGLKRSSASALIAVFVFTANQAPAGQAGTASASSPGPVQLKGHGGPVKAVTVSRDGRRALTGSFDYSAMLWDLTKSPAKPLLRLDDHDGAVNAVAFVPGARLLSAGDDAIVRLWDQKTGKLLHRFTGHRAKIIALAVSRDARLAASASWDRTARLWHLDTGKPGPVLAKGHKGPVNAVLIGPDGTYAYTGGYDGAIIKWRMADGALLRPIHRHGWGINVMQWRPGRRRILFGTVNGDVQIIDAQTGIITRVLIPHQRPVLSLANAPSGRFIASAGGKGIIRVWRTASWSVAEQLIYPGGPVWAMAFAGDRHIFYAGLNDTVTRWKISPRRYAQELASSGTRRFQKLKDMSLGERQFARKCSICHTLKPGGRNRAGPSLAGVFGRRAGSLKNYPYSPALRTSSIIWNAKTIDALFLHGPQAVTPGSKMPLQRISQKHKRDALIRYLQKHTVPAARPLPQGAKRAGRD